jgi:hypothetical protein
MESADAALYAAKGAGRNTYAVRHLDAVVRHTSGALVLNV